MPIVDFVVSNDIKDILEVGSGSLGIGEFLEQKFTGCDVDFNGDINANLNPVKGSVLDLPFKDNSYELVLSVDMLEHVEKRDRALALRELVRVSKKHVLISCPCGGKSEEWEKRLSNWLRMSKKTVPEWLKEHRRYGLPEEQDIVEMLGREQNIRVSVSGNENVVVHDAVILMELTRGFARLTALYKKFPKILNYLKYLDFAPYYRKIFIVEKII